MLWSGFSMFVTEHAYASLVQRVPDVIWAMLLLSGHRTGSRAWHYLFSIVFAANGIWYLIAALRRRTWYHGAQKYAYGAVIALAVIMIVTGASMWFHPQLLWLQSTMGGKRVVENIHIIIASALLVFIIGHVVQVIRAGPATFFTMLVGRTMVTLRSASLTTAVLVGITIGLIVGIRTSAPTGLPVYLHWLVPPDDTKTIRKHSSHISAVHQ
jgi:Prokaryotic cytochrome b561